MFLSRGARTKALSIFNNHYQSYHAAVYDNSSNFPARIRQNKAGNTLLQALTGRPIGPYIKADNTIRQRLFGRDWRTLLIKNKDGVIILEREAEGRDPVRANPPDEVISPQNLYAVPQSIWHAFISTLENQEVVRLLDLNKHRHLWLGYNYAISGSSDDLVYKRANLIGSYHFLLSIVMCEFLSGYQLTGNMYQDKTYLREYFFLGFFEENCEKWYQVKQRKEFIFEEMIKVKNDVDNGVFDLKSMTKVHPSFNALFLKKMRHCTNIIDVNLLGGMVSSYSTFIQKLPNEQRKFDAINWLPSSTTSPEIFGRALIKAKKISGFNEAINGGLFFNSRKQWLACDSRDLREFTLHDYRHVDDYINALFNDLAEREFYLQLSYFKIEEPCAQSRMLLKKRFEKLLINTYSVDQINLLQERWHRNIHAINAAKPLRERGSWTPLIDNLCLDNIQINVLSHETALRAHGAEMGHCVGGYGDKCLKEKVNIIELIDGSGKKSTLELKHSPGFKSEFTILQHRSYNNSSPIAEHTQAALKLVTLMNNGQLAINQKRINETISDNSVGYDLADLTTQEIIYQAYRNKEVLPVKLAAVDYQTMLKKSHLDEIIMSVIEEIEIPALSGFRHKT